MNDHIAVIGSGGWGSAISHLLANKGLPVRLWSYFPEESLRLAHDRENKSFLPGIALPDNITFSSDMGFCVDGARLIVIASPSKGMRGVSAQLSGYIDVGTQSVVSLSKGLDAKTHDTMTQIIEQEISGVKVCALSGPSHAEEVARFLPTTNVAASKHLETAEFVQDTFMTDYFRIYTNPDILGVELGGAIKNVYALCAGIADGLGMGDNAKAALMTRGMAELARLGVAMGAHLETFFGLSGIGDLIVTCTSMHSRNRRAGILIGQGKSISEALEEVKMVVEGVPATAAAYGLAQKCGIEMPIVQSAYRVLFEDTCPKEAVSGLMTRDRRHEMEDVVRHKFKW